MLVIQARNVNEAYRRAVMIFDGSMAVATRKVSPRGMPTIEIEEPVCTVYQYPMERVLFDATRDASPFFHLVEALWILAGRNDVEWLSYFNKNIAAYSDDGVTFRGAYGHRIMKDQGVGPQLNQVDRVVEVLKEDPETRRAVLSIWNPSLDKVDMETKDLPCNTTVYLKIRKGALDILVSCRSNDAIWGAYGANAVQFSVLQEYIAARVGVPVGIYRQISDSLHVYTEQGPWKKIHKSIVPNYRCRYELDQSVTTKIISNVALFHGDLDKLFSNPPEQACSWMKTTLWHTSFFRETLAPMLTAWDLYKQDDLRLAISKICYIQRNSDWLFASHQWLVKRKLDRDLRR